MVKFAKKGMIVRVNPRLTTDAHNLKGKLVKIKKVNSPFKDIILVRRVIRNKRGKFVERGKNYRYFKDTVIKYKAKR